MTVTSNNNELFFMRARARTHARVYII